jgi:hypothetical protein
MNIIIIHEAKSYSNQFDFSKRCLLFKINPTIEILKEGSTIHSAKLSSTLRKSDYKIGILKKKMEKYVDLIKWMNERDQKNVLKKNMKVM